MPALWQAARTLARTLLFYCAALANTVRRLPQSSCGQLPPTETSCGTPEQRQAGSAAKAAARWLAAGECDLVGRAVHQPGAGQLFHQVGVVLGHQADAMLEPLAGRLEFG